MSQKRQTWGLPQAGAGEAVAGSDMKYRKKFKKPIIFIQDTGTYLNELIFCAGGTKNDVIKYLKARRDVKTNTSEWIEKVKAWEMLAEKKAVTYSDDSGRAIITTRFYEDTWDYWETIMHELHHYVRSFSQWKLMEEEDEALAYLQEYLFHAIRRKLQGIDKI